MILNEGGNVTVKMLSNNTTTSAQKIDLTKVNINDFRKLFKNLFIELDKLFSKKFNTFLWKHPEKLGSGFYFNGSTSYIMDPDYNAEEIIKYKQSAGDIDIVVDENKSKLLFNLLTELEGKSIGDFVYMGSNRSSENALGGQINSVFMLRYKNENYPCQVDFELQPFINDEPDEFTKFGHSSSFEDAKTAVKIKLNNIDVNSYIKGGVLHKYILGSVVGAVSQRDDIVIATASSTPDKIKITSAKQHINPRLKAFSVDKGIRTKYEPFLDNDGNPIFYNNKQVFKEIKTSNSNYERNLKGIFISIFGPYNEADFKKMFSFVGICDLIKKYFSKQAQEVIKERFFEKLWGKDAQELERDGETIDYSIKMSGYTYFIDKVGVKPIPNDKKLIKDYYANYKSNNPNKESFLQFLASL